MILFSLIKRYPWTLSYILTIFLINSLFGFLPPIHIWDTVSSPADIAVGAIYVVRDFAQREIKHYIILAMFLGAGLSYVLADKTVAIASLSAFFVGEFIDWAIFTWTRKPLSKRILWSSSISVPLDSAVFLYMMNMLNWTDGFVITFSKLIGIFALWITWRRRQTRNEKRWAEPRVYF